MTLKYDQSASHLQTEDWNMAANILDLYVPALNTISKKVNVAIRFSSVWPRIEFYKVQFGTERFFRFELNPNYLVDGERSFHCYAMTYKKFIFKKNELLSSSLLFMLNEDECKSCVQENSDKLSSCAEDFYKQC